MTPRRENVIDLWDVTCMFLYQKNYVDALVKFFTEVNAKTILDCSRGAGFPGIALHNAGFEMVIADGDKNVDARLQEHMLMEGINIEHHVLDWRGLHRLGERFDAVMCNTNSLVYVGSWNRADTLRESVTGIISALQNMYEVLHDGGVLYVDLPSEVEYDAGPSFTNDLGTLMIDGQQHHILWHVNHDWKNRIRTIHSIHTVAGQEHEYTYTSVLLKHEELIEMVKGVGFSNVHPYTMEGEKVYQGFVATK